MRRGFTLIELLIVIGILAILATTVTLVINPVNLLKEARDIQRISDLRTIQSAISFYLTRNNTSVGSLDFPSVGGNDFCQAGTGSPTQPGRQWRVSVAQASPGTAGYRKSPFLGTDELNTDGNGLKPTNPRDVLGDGWISVNFGDIQGGSPLAKLPLDPVNTLAAASLPDPASLTIPGNQFASTLQEAAYFYAYRCNGLTYEINTNMESQKYSNGGSRDIESTDGGTKAKFYRGTLLGFCHDPIPDSGEACDGTLVSDTYLADLIYEIGNDSGLDL